MYRTVEITCKAEKLAEVLESLKISKEFKENAVFTLSVDIEDIKENYSYLCTSDSIVDWKISSPTMTVEKDPKEKKVDDIPGVSVVSGELEKKKIIEYLLSIKKEGDNLFDYISRVVLSTYDNLRNDRSLEFNLQTFVDRVIPWMNSGINSEMVKVFSLYFETYYKGAGEEAAIKDIVSRIRREWETMKSLINTYKVPSLLML